MAPRLRVKTGCLTCRHRRKRCDEAKPTCGDCTRLQLSCSWPPNLPKNQATAGPDKEPETFQKAPTATAATAATALAIRSYGRPLLPTPKRIEASPAFALSSGYRNFRNQVEHHLFRQTRDILSMMICPIADRSCQELSQLLCVSLQESWSRDALMAFSASFLALQNQELAVTATELYQSAVVGLKSNLLNHATTGRRQMLLAAANALGLIETLCSGDEEKAINHFVAVGHFLSMEAIATPVLPEDLPSQVLYRIVAECVIFNIGSLALFYQRIDRLAMMINWDSFEVYFQQNPKFLKSSYSSSPFLGGRRDIYRIMFAITWLSQCRTKLMAGVPQYINILKYEIAAVQRSLGSYYASDIPWDVRVLYTIKYQLHILAMQIFCLKIAQPEICSSHIDVAALVAQSLSLLATGKLDEDYNPSLCWPLTILLCAVKEEQDFQSLVARTKVLQKMIGAGHATRMSKIISRLSRRRESLAPCKAELDNTLSCDGKHDGLILLLQRGGLT